MKCEKWRIKAVCPACNFFWFWYHGELTTMNITNLVQFWSSLENEVCLLLIYQIATRKHKFTFAINKSPKVKTIQIKSAHFMWKMLPPESNVCLQACLVIIDCELSLILIWELCFLGDAASSNGFIYAVLLWLSSTKWQRKLGSNKIFGFNGLQKCDGQVLWLDTIGVNRCEQ